MKTLRHRPLFSLSLSVLLLMQTLPALAQEAAEGSFDLRLEEALALQGTNLFFDESFQLASVTSHEARPETRFSRTSLASLSQDSERLEEINAQNNVASRTKEKGKFGRWVKKHWYVPVLAAAVIGVAVSDDGSDGPNDVED